MQTIGEYILAVVTFLASIAIAYGLALAFGGPWIEYLVGMILLRVCLWEATGILKGKVERQQ